MRLDSTPYLGVDSARHENAADRDHGDHQPKSLLEPLVGSALADSPGTGAASRAPGRPPDSGGRYAVFNCRPVREAVYDVGGMRRLMIIGACLVGLGWLAWLVRRKSVVGDGVSQPELDDLASPAPQAEPGTPEPEDEPTAGASVESEPGSSPPVTADEPLLSDASDGPERVATQEASASEREAATEVEVAAESYQPSGQWATGQGDPEELLSELAQLRRDALKKVHRHPLYVMAEERGVPRYRRAFMTNGQLFDAILSAEGVSPGTGSPVASDSRAGARTDARDVRLRRRVVAEVGVGEPVLRTQPASRGRKV
jgi:hypothetical protein